jgi:hypothetical protein
MRSREINKTLSGLIGNHPAIREEVGVPLCRRFTFLLVPSSPYWELHQFFESSKTLKTVLKHDLKDRHNSSISKSYTVVITPYKLSRYALKNRAIPISIKLAAKYLKPHANAS